MPEVDAAQPDQHAAGQSEISFLDLVHCDGTMSTFFFSKNRF